MRTILAEHATHIGSNMGENARPVIDQALDSLGIERRTGVAVKSIDAHGVTLKGGQRIEAGTIVWTAGIRASPVTEQFAVQRDGFGRLPVYEYLRVIGINSVFAAGDVAALAIDGVHGSVMSCQHARPMGRVAGYNVVRDLIGKLMVPVRIERYVTCLDLGAWGAVYMEGWDRQQRSAAQRPRPSNRPSTVSGFIRPAHATERRSSIGQLP